jgi:predicted aspartyl protease
VVVPSGSLAADKPLTEYLTLRLADGSTVSAPTYRGELRIGNTRLAPIVITELGDEAIIGLRVLNEFTLTIDHGHTLTIEP